MPPPESTAGGFADLALPEPLMKALVDVGYETPSAIQSSIIPHMLEGADVVGQAQTGTGKTAAFALPLLARLEAGSGPPQGLVLTPTRELAIQVAEAFQKYARHLDGFHVLPIYGGADYRGQLRQLQRGVQVVVGTPGRVMDHMRRGSLDLSRLRTLVLDEADEMLRMGFIDDVQWILERTPEGRQVALFSATMPEAIARIARGHLNEPREVAIEVKKVTSSLIRQRVWMMAGVHKLDALTRILETEDFNAMIIFVRTRLATTELADKLAARGYATAALNGDIPQKLREKTVEQLKSGKLDILVATDVAARGLDVERISHVINYDIPYDVEAYVHRIGRTGRAGREGDAILFAANRERRLLRAIEKATGKSIEKMELPTAEEVADRRIGKFKRRIDECLATADLDVFRRLVEEYQREHGVPVLEIAAALAHMAQGDQSLVPPVGRAGRDGKAEQRDPTRGPKRERQPRGEPGESGPGKGRERSRQQESRRADSSAQSTEGQPPERERRPAPPSPGKDMERFRIEVGRQHGVKPGNIVGAIANEAELDAEYIGHIEIGEDHSTVDLPSGMPKEIFRHLKSVWVSGQRLQISRHEGAAGGPRKRSQRRKPAGGKHQGKPQ